MPAYIIVDVDIKDAGAFHPYVENVPALVRKHGGAYLAVSDTPQVIEGDWKPNRLVLVRFPDMQSVRSFLEDPEYRPWKELRQKVAKSDMVAMEGLR